MQNKGSFVESDFWWQFMLCDGIFMSHCIGREMVAPSFIFTTADTIGLWFLKNPTHKLQMSVRYKILFLYDRKEILLTQIWIWGIHFGVISLSNWRTVQNIVQKNILFYNIAQLSHS